MSELDQFVKLEANSEWILSGDEARVKVGGHVLRVLRRANNTNSVAGSLEDITGIGAQPDAYALTRDPVVIGRSHTADNPLIHQFPTMRVDNQLSRIHASVSQSPNGDIAFRDLGSKNGTFVEGEGSFVDREHSLAGDISRLREFFAYGVERSERDFYDHYCMIENAEPLDSLDAMMYEQTIQSYVNTADSEYMFYGNNRWQFAATNGFNENDEYVRMYINTQTSSTLEAFEALLASSIESGVDIRAKVSKNPHDAQARKEKIVIWSPISQAEQTLASIENIYKQAPHAFLRSEPTFTARVRQTGGQQMHGVSVGTSAQSSNRSFGQERSFMVYEAYQKACEEVAENGRTPQLDVSLLKRELEMAGVDPQHPAFAVGSIDSLNQATRQRIIFESLL